MSRLAEQSRLDAAIAELRGLIAARFPQATFAVFEGEDPAGVYLEATADLEDSEALLEPVLDRLVAMHVDEGLPVYVLTAQPLARILAQRTQRLRGHPPTLPPAAHLD